MRDKKKTKSGKTPELEALEKHVDAMMDPKRPDEAPSAAAPPPVAQESEPKITAIAAPAGEGPTTAPQLSSKLRKQIGVADAPDKPLSIDKLDELAKSITESDPPEKSKKPAAKTEAPEEPEPATDIAENDAGLDDAETDKAVDDIVAYESDVMLAVADSTAAARSQEASPQAEPKKHRVLSTIFWTLVAFVAILIVLLSALLVMGDSLVTKLGL